MAHRTAGAELAEPNALGVSMGHLHFFVHDVEPNVRFWTDFGGTAERTGDSWRVSFPDIDIIVTPGDYSGNSHGAVVSHVAFRVQSLKALEAQGIPFEYFQDRTSIATKHTPEGERVELFDDGATNIGFTPDTAEPDEVAERHNRQLDVPVSSHHLHYHVPGKDVVTAKAWYTTVFGGVPGKRWEYEAVDLPGINLNFSEQKEATVSTKGRMIDHIGFEVADLDAFARSLTEKGIAFDDAGDEQLPGVRSVFLYDPWGTRIALTERR
jgi:catechol 2,3-dioxygenase-like lactoylglutathione lyase family enzyme